MSPRQDRFSRRLAIRAVWQPDKWERLSQLSDHVGDEASSVLDVGGRGREMAALLPQARVVSANVEAPADVVVPPDGLPFDDDSFDVVTSSDVIEHMAADQRPGHIAELLRVARHRLALCCPYESPSTVAAELRLRDRLEREVGFSVDFLDDHIDFGLPTEADLVAMIDAAAPTASVTTRYQPFFEGGEDLVVDGMLARHRRDPRALLRFARACLTRRPPPLTSTPDADCHRLFVTVDLRVPDSSRPEPAPERA